MLTSNIVVLLEEPLAKVSEVPFRTPQFARLYPLLHLSESLRFYRKLQ